MNNKGSMAFRTMEDPAGGGYPALPNSGLTTFQFLNNKIDVSGLTDVSSFFWSTVECNNFEKVIVKGNVANSYRDVAVGGARGFLQVWSKGPEMIIEVENNKLTDYNIAYQLAFGNESSAAVYYGCTNTNSYVTMAQNDLTRVDKTYSLIYPWLSATAVVNLVSGVLPTITAPSAVTSADLTGSLVETFVATSLADIHNHTFDIGSNTTGYIQVTNTVDITRNSSASGGNGFAINIKSDIALAVTKFWIDQVVVPANSTFLLIEQERSWNGDTMSKRMKLGTTNIPANAAFAMKVYFRID